MLRLIVPLIAIILGIVVALSFALNSSNNTNPNANPVSNANAVNQTYPNAQDSEDKPKVEDPAEQVDTTSRTPPSASPGSTNGTVTATTTQPSAATQTPSQTAKTLTKVEELGPLSVAEVASSGAPLLGSDDPESGYLMEVRLARWGAGVRLIKLARYMQTVDSEEHYIIVNPANNNSTADDAKIVFYPYAARLVVINGQQVDLFNKAWSLSPVETTDKTQSARYSLTIQNADGEPVLDIVRQYVVTKGSYDLQIKQSMVNRTNKPLEVQFTTHAQGDLIPDDAAYLGDRRQYVTGYFNNAYDPSHVGIYTDRAFLGRSDVVGDGYIWPNPAVGGQTELVWIASENRYFAVVTHPVIPQGATKTQDLTSLEAMFPTVGVLVDPPVATTPQWDHYLRAMVFTLSTNIKTLQPQKTERLDFAAYVGPRDRTIYDQFPYNILQIGQLIRYELGCFCTFQWLAQLLLGFLTFLHSIFGDWGVAIIILTCIVRLLLHPLTKKAQVNMMKMGKQMQAMQPEMEKLREKYKDDQQKLNAEMMKLYREKGVNPANVLGCLPMFLQMPIWIALYAMLYFAIELRHQPAFYNVFHTIGSIFGFDWQFLSDLSSPDHFMVFFDEPHIVPLLLIQFDYSALNILPILMGGIFYFQQKFMTPPATNEQAEQTQKMMRIMIPILFPFMLYSAPSGLTLYILVSTAIGVLDSWLVRRHVAKLEESGELFKKKDRKPGGFMDRMSKAIEQRQQQITQQEPSTPKKRKKK